MNTLRDIVENATIDGWARHFKRSPDQMNGCHQTDAELIRLPGDPMNYLAATIDTVAEEIALGIYRDPYTMGWVTIMASLSDLAAVGAQPLGMLIAVSMAPDCDPTAVDKIAEGMEDACQLAGTFVIGGDTNEGPVTSLTGCALGLVPRENAMSRIGCKPGDSVFMTGAAGTGNALGLVKLAGYPEHYFPERLYRPRAALAQGRMIREYATCCMDTSDGVLTTLDQLMRLNDLGFEIDCDWQRLLAPQVRELCRRTNTPEWMMLAGSHGEFELLFTVPQARVETLQAAFHASQLPLIQLGQVVESRQLSLQLALQHKIIVDMAPLRNLFHFVDGDLRRFLLEFREIGKQWGAE